MAGPKHAVRDGAKPPKAVGFDPVRKLGQFRVIDQLRVLTTSDRKPPLRHFRDEITKNMVEPLLLLGGCGGWSHRLVVKPQGVLC